MLRSYIPTRAGSGERFLSSPAHSCIASGYTYLLKEQNRSRPKVVLTLRKAHNLVVYPVTYLSLTFSHLRVIFLMVQLKVQMHKRSCKTNSLQHLRACPWRMSYMFTCFFKSKASTVLSYCIDGRAHFWALKLVLFIYMYSHTSQ